MEQRQPTDQPGEISKQLVLVKIIDPSTKSVYVTEAPQDHPHVVILGLLEQIKQSKQANETLSALKEMRQYLSSLVASKPYSKDKSTVTDDEVKLITTIFDQLSTAFCYMVTSNLDKQLMLETAELTLQYLKQVLRIHAFRRSCHKYRDGLYVKIVTLYMALGKRQGAERYCFKALDELERTRIDDKNDIERSRFTYKLTLARIYLSRGYIDFATKFIENCLAIYTKTPADKILSILKHVFPLYEDIIDHFKRQGQQQKIVALSNKGLDVINQHQNKMNHEVAQSYKAALEKEKGAAQGKLEEQRIIQLKKQICSHVTIKNITSSISFTRDGENNQYIKLVFNTAQLAKDFKLAMERKNISCQEIQKTHKQYCDKTLFIQLAHVQSAEQIIHACQMSRRGQQNRTSKKKNNATFFQPASKRVEPSRPVATNEDKPKSKKAEPRIKNTGKNKRKDKSSNTHKSETCTTIPKPAAFSLQWPSGCSFPTKTEATEHVHRMHRQGTPENMWLGYIPECILETLGPLARKLFIARLESGKITKHGIRSITTEVSAQNKDDSEHFWVFKLVIKGKNGVGDLRLYGWVEEVITDKATGHKHFLVCFGFLKKHNQKLPPVHSARKQLERLRQSAQEVEKGQDSQVDKHITL